MCEIDENGMQRTPIAEDEDRMKFCFMSMT